MKTVFEHKPDFTFREFAVEKTVTIPARKLEEMLRHPMCNHEAIGENAGVMGVDGDGVYHCLLVTGEGHRDGVLVEAEGYGYARYASYVPDAAASAYDSLSEIGYRLAFLVDLFVTEGAAAASEGYWEISFEKIREQSDLELGENPFLQELMADMIVERPEVAEVCIWRDCFNVRYHPEFCHDHQKNFSGGGQEKTPVQSM